MKINSSFITKALVLALSSVGTMAQAYDFKVGGVYYNYTSDRKGAIVTYSDLTNNDYSGNITIPTTVSYQLNTMEVKGIGDHAFFNCQMLESITLPDNITYIDEQAFSHCYALKSITLPAKLSRIADYAFEYCEDMTSLTIPASVTQIGYMVFYQCNGLTEIKVEEGNRQFCAVDGVLYLNDMSILIQYPASKKGETFVVPDEVKTITDYAFSPALYLTKITIGQNVSAISPATFCECSAMKEFEVAAGNTALSTVDGALYDKDIATLLQYPIGNEAADYILPETVTKIADMAIMGAVNLSSIKLPATLGSIGAYSLGLCSGLKRIIALSATPPATSGGYYPSFDNSLYTSATLYVNKDDIQTYRNDATWGKFASIEAYDASGGVTEMASDSRKIIVNGSTVSVSDGSYIEAYDLTGNLVSSGYGEIDIEGHGLFIVTTNGTATKIIL